MVKVKEDLTSKKFGRLTVVKQGEDYIYPSGKRKSRWECICDCGSGKTVIAQRSNLERGITTSCGCYRNEKVADALSKSNIIDISGEFGIGWTNNTNAEFYFDITDYDLIKDYCWHEDVDKRTGYHSLKARVNNKDIKMHQLFGYNNYDHINKNPLDNRRNNLRPCTKSENQQNRTRQSNNTSGVIGVAWHKQAKKWWAYICVKGNNKNLGLYINKEDAIRARLYGEKQYFSDGFEPQRHLFEQYGIVD